MNDVKISPLLLACLYATVLLPVVENSAYLMRSGIRGKREMFPNNPAFVSNLRNRCNAKENSCKSFNRFTSACHSSFRPKIAASTHPQHPFLVDGTQLNYSNPHECGEISEYLSRGILEEKSAANGKGMDLSSTSKHPLDKEGSSSMDLAVDISGGHLFHSQNVSTGEIAWDDYDPGISYNYQMDDYLRNRIKNPYYNGDIRGEVPSYLNPSSPYLRSGRYRDKHRKTDTGVKQRKRWGGPSPWNKGRDISRGNWSMPDDRFKELLGSVDWERPYPVYHDNNYYKRSIIETGWSDYVQAEDSYWDIQFIGSPDAFPNTELVGPNVSFTYNWVPWLKKKYSRKYGQPIKSFPFNLGGIDPIQLWFWPSGTASSLPGFCSIKLLTRPGWCLPYPIYLWAQSEGHRIQTGPLIRESADYVSHCLNFCRLRTRDDAHRDPTYNSEHDLILGPAGNVCIGVAIANSTWEWDDGAGEFENWLKKQSALPDNELTALLSSDFSHSERYENFKYDYVPDKHFSKYLPHCRDLPKNSWNRHSF
ncbi:hypothetical protein IE077_003525 [Cardiosporidium cionae]|uniref:Uncharacterized protein n=1 Tax=Cardiosporidium cionae TaxID=476202 RepID=A0ABQ7J814_9APIC|nr:hypothetical protein IE077_003525 [Cardiosporidium cionae]|eukprot:KAF8820127.1 hypothetical protein IE077_003525 [Cardiosporidium cionae]